MLPVSRDDGEQFEVTVSSCSTDAFKAAVNDVIEALEAEHGSQHCANLKNEMKSLLAVDTINFGSLVGGLCDEVTQSDAILASHTTFRDVFAEIDGYFEEPDDIEFFHGGTFLNTEYDGAPGVNPLSRSANFVSEMYSYATSEPMAFPEYVDSLANCNANAVTCCYVADRQPDDHGTCTSGSDCSNADPVDNTDVCYVDNSNSKFASHTKGGYSIYPGDSEGDVYCEGFAWSKGSLGEPSYRYRANTLYQVALMDNLYTRGYVREVPGAPMCGCVEHMPVISDAACTEPVVDEAFTFFVAAGSTDLEVEHVINSIGFQPCAEGGLKAHYDELYADGKVNDNPKARFDAAIVEDCDSAIASALRANGYSCTTSPCGSDV